MNILIVISFVLIFPCVANDSCNSEGLGHLEEKVTKRRVLKTDEAYLELGVDGSDVYFRLENENKVGNDRDYKY